MKRLILFSFVALGLIFAGCSDQSSLVGPSQQISPQQGSALIALPVSSLDKSIEASEEINGVVGGTIKFEGTLNSGQIAVEGTLVIPAGAFTGTKNISIKSDNTTASFQFGPSGTFDAPLSFSAKISGLNLNVNNVNFVYAADNGSLIPTANEGVGYNDGTLYINNAQLGHFSRYGWGK